MEGKRAARACFTGVLWPRACVERRGLVLSPATMRNIRQNLVLASCIQRFGHSACGRCFVSRIRPAPESDRGRSCYELEFSVRGRQRAASSISAALHDPATCARAGRVIRGGVCAAGAAPYDNHSEPGGMAVSAGASPSELFRQWRAGDAAALQQLLPLVYDELRRVARAHLRRERADHTLQTTALVHEAYLRLIQQRPHEAGDRCQFVAVSSNLMRQILVDHARARLADKRQGGCRVTLSEGMAVSDRDELDVIAVDEALHRLLGAELQHAAG